MTREIVNDVRIWCDGCGEAVLELALTDEQVRGESDALDEHGWLTRSNVADAHLCPTCRPDMITIDVKGVAQRGEQACRPDSEVEVLYARIESLTERAEYAEAEVERLNRIISESKPWIDMADELADAQATIQRVREVCDLWQRWHDSAIRHTTDIPAVAIAAVLRALEGDVDE